MKTKPSYQIKAHVKGKQSTVLKMTGSYGSAVRAAKAVLESDDRVTKTEVIGNGRKEEVKR